MYNVYILESQVTGRYYIGVTNDIERRLHEHNAGLNRSTKGGIPWILRKVEKYVSISDAYRREKFLKARKSRKIIELVIQDT